MVAKVFISWSGELSRELGEILRDWLPSTLQYVRPYFTPADIEKGTKWSTEIAAELESSHIGVICLTRDNTEKPWILFEAGALSKSIDKGRVCTLLFNLEATDVKGPLTHFQATRFAKDDFKRLVTAINGTAGDARLEPAVLDRVFEMWWPRLEADVSRVLSSNGKVGKTDKRSDRDMLEEILGLVRMGSRPPMRPQRFSQKALAEVVESLNYLADTAKSEVAEILLARMSAPLRHLCMEAGIPRAYAQFETMRTVRASGQVSTGEGPDQPTKSAAEKDPWDES